MSKKPNENTGSSIAALMNGIVQATKGDANQGPQPTTTHTKNKSLAGKREADRVKGKAMYANKLRTKPPKAPVR